MLESLTCSSASAIWADEMSTPVTCEQDLARNCVPGTPAPHPSSRILDELGLGRCLRRVERYSSLGDGVLSVQSRYSAAILS